MQNSTGIQSIVKSTFFDKGKGEDPACGQAAGKCPVVALSRSFGSNGSLIADLVSQKLQVSCFGYTMIDGIIEEAKTNKQLMKLMDEQFPDALEDWIRSLLTGGKVSKANYIRRLIKTVQAVGKAGGVVIGRGAHIILANRPNVFRVRVEGDLQLCAKRVADREGVSIKKALEKIKETDQERKKFVAALYKQFPNDRSYYDLVLCSDRLTPQDAAEIIVYTMKKMGYID